MIDEIDVHEKRGFFICEAAFQTKETAVKRPVACATESGDQIGPVVGSDARISTRYPLRSASI
jgi:hypothetical protein